MGGSTLGKVGGGLRKGLQRLLRAAGSREAFSPWPMAVLSLAVLGGWLAAVCLMSARHEPWGDEVRALTLALEPAHWWQLPQALRGEGHPVLWYLILRIAYDLFGTTVVLKGASVAVAFLAVGLLLWRGPFPLWWKVLFMGSFLPLYEYSVLARNYGLTLLFAFAFAAAYPLRKRQPFLLALVLALLANSNVHSVPLVLLLCGTWIWEAAVVGGREGLGSRITALAFPLVLVLVSVAGALVTCMPDKDLIPPGVGTPTVGVVLHALAPAVLHPGAAFPLLLPFGTAGREAVVWLLLAGLWVWRPGLVVLLGYELALQVLFVTVYPGGLRHQGLWLVAAVALYWIGEEREIATPSRRSRFARALNRLALFGVFPLVLLTHCWLSRGPIARDWSRPFSSNRALAAYLPKEPGMDRAILIPEPDTALDSLPYYSDARIYYPRQGRFARRGIYTRSYHRELSLGQLLAVSEAVKRESRAPVLVVLGEGIPTSEGEPGRVASGRATFTWTPQEAAAFKAATRRVASFTGALSGENYVLYRLVP